MDFRNVSCSLHGCAICTSPPLPLRRAEKVNCVNQTSGDWGAVEVVRGRTRGRGAGGGARTGVSLKESTVSLDWMEKEVTLGGSEDPRAQLTVRSYLSRQGSCVPKIGM